MYIKHITFKNFDILDVMVGAVVVVAGVVVVDVVVVVVVVVAPIFVRTLYVREVTRVVPNMSCNENPWFCVTSDCLFVSVHPRREQNILPFSKKTSQHSPVNARHLNGARHISSLIIESVPSPIQIIFSYVFN